MANVKISALPAATSVAAADVLPIVQSATTKKIAAEYVMTPVGVVVPFAGTGAPTGWLMCFGQAVSRSTYANLFTVISTTYGIGDGSTTFNLPDLRGRVAAGLDNMGGTDAGRLDWANAAGTTGGAQTHTLTISEMPSHTHVQDAHGHQFLGKFGGSTTISSTLSSPGSANVYGLDNSYIGNTTATNQNTGGGGAHNNMQPTILLNYIIKI